MTEPTDQELQALWVSCDHPLPQSFARAVLAKWGTPPAVAGEPVAWHVCSVNSDGSLSLEHAAAWEEAAHEHINDAITEHGIAEASSWVVRPAYHTPPTQAQAGAVPLTEEQIDALSCRDGLTNVEVPVIQWLVREVEFMHGIKGKEAGNADI